MNRLYEKGLIADPIGKAKSVIITEEGFKAGRSILLIIWKCETKNSERTAEIFNECIGRIK
jgi:hypothetical protein